MSFEFELNRAMKESGLLVDSINLTPGVYHRFKTRGECKDDCCFYRIFDNYDGAHYGCFRRGIDGIWFLHKDSKEIKAEFLQEKLKRLQNNILKEEGYAKVAKRCVEFLDNISISEDLYCYKGHKYLENKQISVLMAPYYFQVRNIIAIPVRNINYQVQSIQFISEDGGKKFKKGGKIKGGMIWLCGYLPEDYSGVIRICEGWSTGCAISLVTRYPVICALNSGNFPLVALLVRRKYPHAIIKICADNDCWGEENAGLRSAIKAAKNSNATIYFPEFVEDDIQDKPTDFNDLYCAHGIKETRRQLKLLRK